MTEQHLTSDTPSGVPVNIPIVPEILVPRLGEYLQEKGVLSVEGLQQALRYQEEMTKAGQPRLLGQALLDLKLIDRETLDLVITQQILSLHDALQRSNRRLEQRVKERTVDLQNALTRLAGLNQLKTNFISNISHELRTPLTHIKGYLDVMADGTLGDLNKEQSEAIDVILRAEGRLEQLIDNLIQFSLAAKGEFSLIQEPLNTAQMVQAVSDHARKMAKSRNISFEVDTAKDLPYVLADGEKINWALMQLLDNAIKFTSPGGSVRFEVIPEEKIVTFIVADTGIGIPEDRINEIFEPFHQLDGSDTRRYGGTGLGLALVQRIIDAHGSMIKVQSKVGLGSTFKFSLPVTKDGNV